MFLFPVEIYIFPLCVEPYNQVMLNAPVQ